jgi:uncharacterized protein YpbB
MMTFLNALILWGLKRIRSERTVYSVFHLVKGKKSSQTIQDAHFYKLDNLFHTFPNLKREAFDKILQTFVNQSLLVVNFDLSYHLTNEGERQLLNYFKERTFPAFLNGMKLQEHSLIFWKRLTIMIQVMSNLIYSNRHYYPIQRDQALLRWLKQFIASKNMSKEQLSSLLYEELYSVFSNEPPENPDMMVIRLTGYTQIGKTTEQAARQFGLETTEYWYRFLNLLHYFIEKVMNNKTAFPVLNSLIQDVNKPFPMTKSTLETYELLLKKFSITKISEVRKLKENTIQDHIIEIALTVPNYSIQDFMDKNTEEKIISMANNLGKQKLKPIKEHLEGVTYFQIRLALAKNR